MDKTVHGIQISLRVSYNGTKKMSVFHNKKKKNFKKFFLESVKNVFFTPKLKMFIDVLTILLKISRERISFDKNIHTFL